MRPGVPLGRRHGGRRQRRVLRREGAPPRPRAFSLATRPVRPAGGARGRVGDPAPTRRPWRGLGRHTSGDPGRHYRRRRRHDVVHREPSRDLPDRSDRLRGLPGPRTACSAPTSTGTRSYPTRELGGDAHHLLHVADDRCWTHVRLVIAPDGGVARLRVHGLALPDPRKFDSVSVDLASWATGGLVVASSDDFYGSAQVVNRPDQARNMGEGWETRRRRDKGHDWLLVRLGYAGTVSRLVIDTSYYRYNASEAVSVTGSLNAQDTEDWAVLLGRTRLQPDTVHDLRANSCPAGQVCPLRRLPRRGALPPPGGGPGRCRRACRRGTYAGGTRCPSSRQWRSWPPPEPRPPPRRRSSPIAPYRSGAPPLKP